ncbi:MAG: orotidine 5'-phosphate decarboxylase / HUMPS family protein [Christensenellaceae bacterium]|jgi:3-hexulose-6-phosphate synthase
MKLQVALDVQDIDVGMKLIEETKDYVDIFELGTGFMGMFGYPLVKTFRDAFPDITLLADVKIVDGGYGTSKRVFEYGANFSTVVGYADVPTLAGAVEAVKEAGPGHYVMADLMHVPDFSVHAQKLNDVGVDYVNIHVATDSGSDDAAFESVVSRVKDIDFQPKLSVAGGITIERLPIIEKYNFDLIIVGGAITRVDDPRAAAKAFKEAIS